MPLRSWLSRTHLPAVVRRRFKRTPLPALHLALRLTDPQRSTDTCVPCRFANGYADAVQSTQQRLSSQLQDSAEYLRKHCLPFQPQGNAGFLAANCFPQQLVARKASSLLQFRLCFLSCSLKSYRDACARVRRTRFRSLPPQKLTVTAVPGSEELEQQRGRAASGVHWLPGPAANPAVRFCRLLGQEAGALLQLHPRCMQTSSWSDSRSASLHLQARQSQLGKQLGKKAKVSLASEGSELEVTRGIRDSKDIEMSLMVRAARNLPIRLLAKEYERILKRRLRVVGGSPNDKGLRTMLQQFRSVPPFPTTRRTLSAPSFELSRELYRQTLLGI